MVGTSRRRGETGAVFGVMLLAGVLFVVAAQTSHGRDLRDDSGELTGLVQEQTEQVEQLGAEVTEKTARVTGLTDLQEALPHREEELTAAERAAGLTAVSGPGLTVTLTDAPKSALTSTPDVTADDLVVHQQDVEGVVNALWTGGADAMMLQDQRVISTSAFRCVGNTLLLHGRVYSPPFTVTAIGDPEMLLRALEQSESVSVYREWVDYVGLGYSVTVQDDVQLPGYEGPVELREASTLAPAGSARER